MAALQDSPSSAFGTFSPGAGEKGLESQAFSDFCRYNAFALGRRCCITDVISGQLADERWNMHGGGVFAHDRPGQLYLISQSLYQLELSVVRARISTHFDQGVDGFYVTNPVGRKIHDEQRLKSIHDRLHEAINRFELAARAASSPKT